MQVGKFFVLQLDKFPILHEKIRKDTMQERQRASNQLIVCDRKQHRQSLILGEQQETLADEFSTQ